MAKKTRRHFVHPDLSCLRVFQLKRFRLLMRRKIIRKRGLSFYSSSISFLVSNGTRNFLN